MKRTYLLPVIRFLVDNQYNMSRDYPINPIGLTVSDRDFHRWLSKGAAAFREDESDPSTLNAEGVTRGLQDFVMDLTLEDLRTPARPWRGDFLDSGQVSCP